MYSVVRHWQVYISLFHDTAELSVKLFSIPSTLGVQASGRRVFFFAFSVPLNDVDQC